MPAPSSLPAVLNWHKQRYPLLEARDVYKLVHQGVFGPGHMIASAALAKRMLEEEMAALEARSPTDEGRMPEPEFEPIDPRGELVRVNLRPLLREGRRMKDEGGKRKDGGSGADSEWLVRALVESARRVKGEPERMRRRLSAAVRWCRKNLPQQAAELEQLASEARDAGYPALHHSPSYSRAYRPAYRVILGRLRQTPNSKP